MKNGWVARKLREVTTKIGSGATPLGGEEAYKLEGISLFRSLNVYDDGFRRTKLAYIDEQQAGELSNVVVEPGDVLFNITGASIARCCIAPDEFLPARVNQHVAIIRPDNEKLDPAFLRYLLVSANYKARLLNAGAAGSTRQAITKAQLLDFVVEFPDATREQRRIVRILDEAFDGIAIAKANAEKNLQNARTLFESHLNAIFTQRGDGWEEKKLGELAAFRNGINFTKSSRGESVKIIGVKDFQNNFWAPFDVLETVVTDGALPDTDTVKEGDILFVRSNGSMDLIGRCLVVGQTDEKITHSGFTIKARLNNCGISSRYLGHFLKSDGTRRKMIDGGIGTNIKSLNQTTLSSLVIGIPPDNEQMEIVDQIETLATETARLESIYRRKLVALDAFRKSLLDQAFNGRL